MVLAAVTSLGTLHTHLDVYDPSGSRIGGNFYNDATDVLSLPLTGVYTILVRDYSLTAIGTYDVTLRFTTGRCGTVIGAGETKSGSITKIAQLDAYSMCGVAGSTAIFSSVATSGTLHAHLDVYDPAGRRVSGNFYNDSTPSIPLTSTGPYTIIVRDYSLTGIGTYNVNATVVGATCVLPAPTIVSHPTNRVVRVGQTAQFSVDATSIPEPTYGWQVSFDGGATWADLNDAGTLTGSRTTTLTLTGVAAELSNRRYRGVVRNGPAIATSAAATLTVKPGGLPGDFDGDQRLDLTVYRPSTGHWFAKLSGSNYTTALAHQWGAGSDIPVPGDYDGDGTTDYGVYRPGSGSWYVLLSSTGYTTYILQPWGTGSDIPVPGDYDGDGRTDIGVFRPSSGTWYILQSSTNYTTVIVRQWGANGDVPVPGDYDGDSQADYAVYRPAGGYWYVLQSSSGYGSYITRQWGVSTDVVAPGDYDGDGMADFAVYRPSTGTWYVLTSSTGYAGYTENQWGTSTDVVAPGDYDGDGKTDFAVYRPSTGTWYVLTSIIGGPPYIVEQWGIGGDVLALARP